MESNLSILPIDDNIIEPVIVPIPGIVFILESILLYSLVCTLYYLDSYQVEYIEIDKYK